MHKQLVIFFLGILVALLPILGFPGSWKTVFYVLSGFAIALLSFLILYRQRAVLNQDKVRSPLSDSAPAVNA